MQDLSLHLLDIIENSARAKAKLIQINISVNESDNLICFKIIDDGCGMDADTLQNAQNPFYTSKVERQKKVGLGIPLFMQNAEWCNGSFLLQSTLNEGTILSACFELDHIDRMPLGNIADTLLGSILGHAEIDYFIALSKTYLSGEISEFILDTREIKSELGDIPITWPDVIQYLNELIIQGVKNTILEEF